MYRSVHQFRFSMHKETNENNYRHGWTINSEVYAQHGEHYANWGCEMVTANAAYSPSWAAIWEHFGFSNYISIGETAADKITTVCRLRYTQLRYVGCVSSNISNSFDKEQGKNGFYMLVSLWHLRCFLPGNSDSLNKRTHYRSATIHTDFATHYRTWFRYHLVHFNCYTFDCLKY